MYFRCARWGATILISYPLYLLLVVAVSPFALIGWLAKSAGLTFLPMFDDDDLPKEAE